jgi:phospholipid/cholesterol/gamma-HCH transport system ATP-binding protein
MARFSLPFGKGKEKPARPSWSPAPADSPPPAAAQPPAAESPSEGAPASEGSPWSPPAGSTAQEPSSSSDGSSWLPGRQDSAPSQDEPAPISEPNGGQNQESGSQSSDWKKEAEAQGDVPDSGREPVEPLSMQDRDNEDDQLSRTASPPMDGSSSDSQAESDHEQSGSDQDGGREDSEDFDWEQPGQKSGDEESAKQSGSRVSVVDEKPDRPDPPSGASEEEYKWHTYKVYPSGRPDAVEFIDTYKAFGKNRIIRGLNMGLPEGMVSMILGPSGTGKSVCIKMMVGLLYPDEGDILVHGTSVPNMPDDDLFDMRKKFGLLFQDGALFGSMNLYDNVAFPLRQHTEKSEDEIEDIVMRRLNEVGLGSARDKYPNELSGGMRKRAGFARALVLEPDIVLFDEPDSGLDPVRTALLGELILEIHRDMMEEAKEKQKTHLPTFAVITHDIMSARRVADYINVLWKGRIVEAGPAEDMLNSENPFIRQFLAGESQGPLTMD